tara:strand:- start:4849 stop:7155 length:2307 start_codon:yes stop_codon:yes gene_type:complete
MVEPVFSFDTNLGFDGGATIPQGVDLNIDRLNLQQLDDLQRQLQDQVYMNRPDLLPLYEKVLAKKDQMQTEGGIASAESGAPDPSMSTGIAAAADEDIIGQSISADTTKGTISGYAELIEKYPDIEPFINPSNSTASFNMAQNAILSNEADVLNNIKKYKTYDAEKIGKEKEESLLGVVKEVDKQKREKQQKFFDAQDAKTEKFYDDLYTDDNYDFEKKLALAQFGLELAGGRSYKGKALPILSEAGQNLIKNLSSISQAKKSGQKQRAAARFESEQARDTARFNAEMQADAELGVATLDAVKAGLESRDLYVGYNKDAEKYDAEIQNKILVNTQNSTNDLITKHIEKQFPDAQKVTVQYVDKRTNRPSKPRHGYYYPSGDMQGQIFVTPDPTYGEADKVLLDTNEFVNVRRYAKEGAATYAQAGKMAGNEQFTVADMDKFFEVEATINSTASGLSGIAANRMAFEKYPELAGPEGLIIRELQNYARIADVAWMRFTGQKSNNDPNSAFYTGDGDNKRFYIDQFLDEDLPSINVMRDGQMVQQSILTPDQKKSLQSFVNNSQVIIAEDYDRYQAAKLQGFDSVILGDGTTQSMEDMDGIFGAKDFYNPEADKIQVRTQATIYAVARSRKDTGRLNKDDIERASVSLNIYGKSDLGIQASFAVVQGELQTTLENQIDRLYRASFASVQDPDKNNYFITWLDSYVSRGNYLPDLPYLRKLIEESPLVSDFVKDNAIFRSRDDDSIMYPAGENPNESGFDRHSGSITLKDK